MVTDAIGMFVNPARVFSRQEVLTNPSPVPAADGVYGWWFRQLPPLVSAIGCCQYQDLTLLYAGISPDQPPAGGRRPSTQNIQKRIKYHYAGNAEGSTLRKTLGCLLADELGIQLRRVGSGTRMTFADGEQALSAWMAENACVSWVLRSRPWELEDYLIAALNLPLNLKGNSRNQFHAVLTAVRSRCVVQAKALPILPNPGIGGR
jgi:GIY-YIG catalytic domain